MSETSGPRGQYGSNLQQADIEHVRRIIQDEKDETRGESEAPPATPIADLAPLGLAAFSLTNFLIAIANAGWFDQTLTFVPLALIYGGFVQILVAMWEVRNNNTFGVLTFGSYGAFWFGFGLFFLLAPSLGITQATENTAIGFTVLAWAIFTTYVWIASLGVNVGLFALFTTLMIVWILLDIGFLAGAPVFIVAGGYAGIVLSVIGWYLSAAGLFSSVFGRNVLPVGGPLVGQAAGEGEKS